MLPCLRGAVRRTEGWIKVLINVLTFSYPLRLTARLSKTGGQLRYFCYTLRCFGFALHEMKGKRKTSSEVESLAKAL